MKRQNPYNWELMVHCGGEQHIVRYKDGKLQFPNHGTSFRQFKTLWAMSGGQDCGCMSAVKGYRKLADFWKKGAGESASLSTYLHASSSTQGMEAWSRLSGMFNYATARDRRMLGNMLTTPTTGGMDTLRTKLRIQRTRMLEGAFSRFNDEAERHMVARRLSISKGTVSDEYCAEVFSELNLRGHDIAFTISLPAWAKLVRAFGRASVPSYGGLGNNHRLLLNARVVGMTAEGNLVTRFWGLSVTGNRNPSIVTVDRTTSISPEERSIRHSWSDALTTVDLTPKNLQKVYHNG